ncbi:MAG TPA: AAA family ATPase [Roseiflexaceae bacterium]|nr:AAA family ATPase [Roseiflexaceae bacterium]
MLTIQLLGPPQITLDGEHLSLTRRKSRALLFYLAAQAAPVGRDQLIELLWPDLDRPAAQQTLRTTLHGLRKALGGWVVADEALALAPDAQVDVRRLQRVLAVPPRDPAALQAALDLGRGEFLQGFSLPDAPAFDDWIAAQRARFQQLRADGLAALATLHEGRGDYRAALAALENALAADPLQEDVQRAAMRLHYLAGDRVGAIRRYEQLRELLDDELGVPPMPETRALYDAIVTDRLAEEHPPATAAAPAPALPAPTLPPAVPAPPDALPFAGRAAELATLRALVGSGRLGLICGEPGIGKTRLAEEFIRASGALPLVGGARELEHALPYQPVIEALRGLLARPDWPALQAALHVPTVWLSETARLLPELAPEAPAASAQADESRLWEGVSQLLHGVARLRPLILLLDDLHWADASTLGLLGYLVRQAPQAITFLATSRPVAPRTPPALLLQTLTREGRLERLDLERLASEEIAALARHLSPADPAPLAGWLAQTAEGNPYILAELVRYARAHGLLHADGTLDRSALARSPIVPQSVYSLIQSRLDRLSETARRVLDAAVAAGREFEFAVVALAAGLSETDALDALDELRAAGLVLSLDGLRYLFDHSLTMEVAYREVGEPRHRLMHRRVAEALEQRYRGRLDEVAGLLASHYSEGQAPEQAARHAFQAGRHAAALAAWHEAVGFYEQALVGAEGPQRRQILMALGEAYINRGEAARASELFGAAQEQAQQEGLPDAANEARLALTRSLLPQGRYSEMIELARRVREEGSPTLAMQAEFLWGTALSVEGTDLEGAAEHLRSAELLVQQQPVPTDAAALAQIRFDLGNVAAQQGHLREAVRLYRESLITAQSLSCEHALSWEVLAHNNLAYHLLLLDDPEASEHIQAALRLAEDHGLLSMQPYLFSTAGEIALAAGDLDAAERWFEQGQELADRLAIPERQAGILANHGLLALRRGQTGLAIHHLSAALARADNLGLGHLAAQIRIWLAPLLPPADAQAALREARTLAERGRRLRLLEQIERLSAEPAKVLSFKF